MTIDGVSLGVWDVLTALGLCALVLGLPLLSILTY